MDENKFKGFDTQSIHYGHTHGDGSGACAVPIYQTNAYEFESTEQAADLFALRKDGHMYTRLSNPTTEVLEKRIAALDNGVGAVAFASGHAALAAVFLTLCSAGDEIVASRNIYGGAISLLGNTLKRLGITVKFINPDSLSELKESITEKTKAVFYELIGNPNANVCDVEGIARIAHERHTPVIIDSTFNTPYLCKPVDFGADIVVHSATKFLGGHGSTMCGIVVDSGNFTWENNPKFPEFNTPDQGYHGVVYAKDFGKAAFSAKLRTQALRDYGACVAPISSFLILQGIETLSLRMRKHCENAQAVAEYLSKHQEVSFVNYPGLATDKYYLLSQKYLPKGAGSIFTFGLKGGKERGRRFIESLSLFTHCANVADSRSLVTHPASTTHSQLSAEQLISSGINEETIRISIGVEYIGDILTDLEDAINAC